MGYAKVENGFISIDFGNWGFFGSVEALKDSCAYQILSEIWQEIFPFLSFDSFLKNGGEVTFKDLEE